MRNAFRGLFVFLIAAGMEARAAEIDYQFDPNRHNRFLSGFGVNPVQNPNVLGLPGLDFSGVGWGSGGQKGMNVAMVTPRHFIAANHFKPNVGSSLTFLGSDGLLRSYTVQNYIPLRYDPPEVNPANVSDLIIGQLVETIQPAHNIKIYGVVRPGQFQYPFENTPPEFIDFYRGREVVVVGQNETGGTDANGDGYNDRGGKIGKNIIDDIGVFNFGTTDTNTVGVGYESPFNTPDAARLVGGDSGSPLFMLYQGQLTALGSHSGIIEASGGPPPTIPQYNIDGFLPYYFDQINALIAGTGFQLTQINPVPEPGTMALIAAAGAGWFAWRKRRHWGIPA
jgi:hypothetical protein